MKKFMAGVVLTIIAYALLSGAGQQATAGSTGIPKGYDSPSGYVDNISFPDYYREYDKATVYGWDDLWSDMTQEEKDMCVSERANVLQMETPQRERCAAYLTGFDEGMK